MDNIERRRKEMDWFVEGLNGIHGEMKLIIGIFGVPTNFEVMDEISTPKLEKTSHWANCPPLNPQLRPSSAIQLPIH
jgi:hypothetical protein